MERQHVIGNLNYEVIQGDNQSKIWRITDESTGASSTVTVSQRGEISFKKDIPKFPYKNALNGVVQLENRRLYIAIPKGKHGYRKVIEKTNNCEKVPCDGVGFQIYYLSP